MNFALLPLLVPQLHLTTRKVQMREMGAQPEPSKERQPGLRSRFLKPQNILFGGFALGVSEQEKRTTDGWSCIPFFFFF